MYLKLIRTSTIKLWSGGFSSKCFEHASFSASSDKYWKVIEDKL
ncbi:16422_t:CDS:2 [Cetraspora pellucida]|uniref:16422_t:CDS:1 n=1 Tax=Cetraspora pellucida TaxID=1433469 RepID=A0A9N9EPN1_9GLOM|nr:16422_t:CDS:2 [Cetraspora pellucida]